MKVLIVDDSKTMRMIVRRSLRKCDVPGGVEVVEAEDGILALQAVDKEHPDLVLCDWNMPNMNGIEFLEQLRGAGKNTRFGFITSESTEEMKTRARDAGADFFLSKPFTPEMLQNKLCP
ncbi:MAG: two-component system chemotaxis response regulator CheY [Polyangiales bacterium]|jgi:two-component system chemotaxis response regulator CheY